MARIFVLASALLFLFGLAALTISGIKQSGFGPEAILSIFLLVVLTVGIVGAMRNPPR